MHPPSTLGQSWMGQHRQRPAARCATELAWSKEPGSCFPTVWDQTWSHLATEDACAKIIMTRTDFTSSCHPFGGPGCLWHDVASMFKVDLRRNLRKKETRFPSNQLSAFLDRPWCSGPTQPSAPVGASSWWSDRMRCLPFRKSKTAETWCHSVAIQSDEVWVHCICLVECINCSATWRHGEQQLAWYDMIDMSPECAMDINWHIRICTKDLHKVRNLEIDSVYPS
jgi:hypothetical protein